jgi:hypothetical protein
VGNFPPERLNKAPAGALSRLSLSLSLITDPEPVYDFPAFLEGIWGEEYGDNFHIEEGYPIGYTIDGSSWPPYCGWVGEFEAVYYLNDQNPDAAGLVFASFDYTPQWCLTPQEGAGLPISAFYYEKIDADTYYLINLAKFMTDPHPTYFPDYDYGQPMYETVEDALDELITQGALSSMILGWPSFDKQ